tara:strand:+ start:114 stop:827 length:714 start_codon:yes stop_codon:yes gene_type:complete
MAACNSYFQNKIDLVDQKGNIKHEDDKLVPDETCHRPFTVNDLSSIRNDDDYINYEIAQSQGSGQYILNDYTQNNPECLLDRATMNATVNFRDGNGKNQNNIDTDSLMTFSKVKHERKHQKQLFERPFKTMPFLGRGPHRVEDESFLLSGESSRVSKQCGSLAGVFIENQFTPLVDNLKDHIQNPYNIIPEDSSVRFVRGGISTRNIVKDIDYLSRCNDEQEIKNQLINKKKFMQRN